MPKATYSVWIDWDNDGLFETGDENVSEDVRNIKIVRGKESQLGHAQAATCEIKLNDLAMKYSPENVLSALHDLILPGRAVRVTANFQDAEYEMFNGFVNKIVPHPHWDERHCYIYALDGLDRLARGVTSTQVFPGICQCYTYGDDSCQEIFEDYIWYQTFTPESNHALVGVGLKLFVQGTLDVVTVGIRATSGGVPIGPDLVSAVLDWENITHDSSGEWYDVSFPVLQVYKDVEYAIVPRESANGGNFLGWLADETAPEYTRGHAGTSTDGGNTWYPHSEIDFMFKEYCIQAGVKG